MTEKKNYKRQLSKEALYYIPTKIIIGVIGFISIPIYTYFFSPESFGIYSLIVTTVTLLSTMFSGWLKESQLRYYDEFFKEKKLSELLTTIFTTLIFTVIIYFIITILLLFLNIQFITMYWWYFIIILITTSFLANLHDIVRLQSKARLYCLLLIYLNLGKLLLTIIIFLFLNLEVESLLISIIFIEITTIFFIIYKLKVYKYVKLDSYSFKLLKRMLYYGLPMIGFFMVKWLLSASDKYVIAFFGFTEGIGIYSVSYSIINNSFQLIISGIMLTSYPLIVSLWNRKGRNETGIFIGEVISVFLIFSIPIFVVFSTLNKEIFYFLLDERYHDGSSMLPILSLGILFLGLAQYSNKSWQLVEKTKMMLKISIIAASINLVLNFIFIPLYGYKSAAVTTAIAYGVFYLLSLWLSKKYLKIRYNKKVITYILLSALLMALFILNFKDQVYNIFELILLSLFALIIYIVILLIFKPTRNEINGFLSILIKKNK